MTPHLSVVIPAYNEAANFRAGLLRPAVDFLAKQKYPWEVIFVDDGSADDTKKLLTGFCRTRKNYRLLTIPHGGKSAAVTAGMLAARGDHILFTDFDQSTPLGQAEKFLAAHRQGADVVIGNRGTLTMDNKLFRRVRSWVFVSLVRLVLLPNIVDSQCGFKSFTRAAARRIFSNLKVSKTGKVSGGYMGAFDVEVLFLAKKLGYQIVQLPVSWKKIEGTRLNPLTEPVNMVRDTVRVRLYDWLGRYDTV